MVMWLLQRQWPTRQSPNAAVLQIQAGPAFTHRIKSNKRPGHNMVTSGMYTYLRHPGYFGWFLWSVGTQVLLCNPMSAVGFAIVVRCTLLAQTIKRAKFHTHAYARFSCVYMYSSCLCERCLGCAGLPLLSEENSSGREDTTGPFWL